jgi:DNA-binding response OmpR family regulator
MADPPETLFTCPRHRARWLGPAQRDLREPGQGGNAAALSGANWCRSQPGPRAGWPGRADPLSSRPVSRILIAEDDPNQRRILQAYLEREGHEVVAVEDGRAAIDETRKRLPDLVVLDVMMPKVDGLDVCRVLRADSSIPIVLVTARSSEDDLLLGLDLGADDYITKPYSPRELTARVRTLLRRVQNVQASKPTVVKIGELEIDRVRYEVRVRSDLVELTPREFSLLDALAETPGRAFTRRELLDRCAGFDHYALERTIDTHLLNLRKKIEPDPLNPRYVLTAKGRGYKLAES